LSYPITYQVDQHDPPLEKDQIPPERGACHDLWIGSITKSAEGKSYAFISLDGVTGDEVSHDELFQLWVIMSGVLSENLEDGGRKKICAEVFSTVQEAVLTKVGGE